MSYEHLRVATEEQLIMFEENASFILHQSEVTLLAIQNERLRRSNPSLFDDVSDTTEEQVEPMPLCSTTTQPTITTVNGGTLSYDSEGCYHDDDVRIERTDISQLCNTISCRKS